MTKRLIDLHTHTHFSDGVLSPSDLVKKAKNSDLAALAITDHDTIDGISEAEKMGATLGIEIIPGVELSASNSTGTLHILGYLFNQDDPGLNQSLQDYVTARNHRNPIILKKLERLGYHLQMEDVEAQAGGNVINRPHIAQAMLKKGFVFSVQEAFDRFLAVDGLAYVPKEIFTPEKIIEIIHQAGGVAVLAHPDQLKCSNLKQTADKIQEIVELGIDGIEAYHLRCSEKHQDFYADLAEKLGCFITGGSDYHGVNQNDTLYYQHTNPPITYKTIEIMKEHLPKSVQTTQTS